MGSFNSDGAVRSKSQSPLRWLILVLACLMMIGNYYCYDNPAALKSQIDDYMGNPGDYETMFSLLYTVYSIPNIFLPFFGGYFVDKLGVRICLLVFTSFIAAGQVIFAFGLSIKSWPVMFIGRVVFGFGGESLSVGNSAILADWFAGKELAFAFGLNLSIARLGSVINNLVSPALASSISVVFALWFGAILCGGAVFCVLLMTPIDKKMDDILAKQKIADDDMSKSLLGDNSGLSSAAPEATEPPPKFSDALKFKLPFWVLVVSCVVVYGCVLPFNNIASTLLLERDFFKEPPSKCTLEIENQCQSSTNQPIHCPSSDYYQPPLPKNLTYDNHYYKKLTGDDIDCTDSTWKNGCTEEYCNRLDDGIVEATTVMSIPYIISACLSPVLGGFIDRFGGRAIIATIAPLCLVIVHTLLGYSKVTPVAPLVGQGLAYSGFAAVLWPSVPLVVEKRLIGLAYGVITSIQNGGLASFPLIVAAIYDSSNDKYIPNVELFFIALAVVGVVVGLYLNYYDVHNNNIFNRRKPADEVEVVLNTSQKRGTSFSLAEEAYKVRQLSKAEE